MSNNESPDPETPESAPSEAADLTDDEINDVACGY